MTVFELILTAVIAGLLGVLVNRLLGLQNAGLLFTIFFGFLGLLLGRFLVYKLGFPEPVNVQVSPPGISIPLLWSVIGGLTTTLFGAYLARRRRRARDKRK